MRTRWLLACVLLASAAVPAAVPAPAAAQGEPPQGAVTWGIAPSSAAGPDGRAAFDYKLDPGAELTDYAALFNFSDAPVTVAVYASDAFTTDQGGFDLLAAGREPVDVGSWVELDVDTVSVPARSRVDVPFRITVPVNATPGDHAGGIVASVTAASGDGDGNQVAVDRRVGTRIYLRVSGELAPALRIDEVAASWDGAVWPFATGTVTTTFLVRNAGNVRLAGAPGAEVAGPFGVGRRNGDAGQLPEILPGDALRVTVRTTGVLPLLRLAVTARVRPFAPQPVTGRPVAPQPVAGQLLVATAGTAIWVVPWPAAWLLAMAAVAVAVRWLLARRRRRIAAGLLDSLERAREQGRADALAEVGASAGAGTRAGPDAGAGTGPPDTGPPGGRRRDEDSTRGGEGS